MKSWLSVFVAFVAAGSGALASAPDNPAAKFFHEEVAPIFVKHCLECHNENTHKGGLSLETRAAALKGGEDGPGFVPGKPGESELLTNLLPDQPGEKPEMPKKKAPLATEEIAKIRRWIAEGAAWPAEIVLKEAAHADKHWWSLQPLSHAAPPAPAGLPEAWSASPIDRFVFAGLAAKGLAPNPPAAPRDLIRRLTYDLTGLPPTPEEVEAFAQDPSGQAYERLVDRLLASPRYGEQWGRHWLDVVRFGESTGFERNVIIDNAWPYRDYVIRAFNEDKPYHDFIVEQLAGDVVGKGQPETEVATAFLVTGPYDNVGNQDAAAQKQIRANTLDDVVTATGATFLGLTVNCARCHNHKFDPVLQEDYYRLQTIFAGVQHGEREVATAAERARYEQVMPPLVERKTKLAQAQADLTKAILARAAAESPAPPKYRLPACDPQLTEDRFEPVEARYVRLRILAASAGLHKGGAQIDEFEVWTAGEQARNVALAANGAQASGASARQAQDFADAYGPGLTIDGRFGERWMAGSPAELTITLARPEVIERVNFSNDRHSTIPHKSQGSFVAEYELLVSSDGKTWQKVADSSERAPLREEFANERVLKTKTTDQERAELARLARELSATEREIAAVPALPKVWAGNFSQPKEAGYIHTGGDPAKHGAEVRPASLTTLDQVTHGFELPTDAPEAERRLALARWLAADENPLTARVIVNRLWQYHFGTGIVDSPSDFGYLGGRPTHPELLDWLAQRLHESGGHLKALQREIVLSQAYRQSADWREAAARVDGDSRLLWRFPPHRLAAEEIRDTLLAVSGRLDLRLGGPGFRLYQYLEDNVATYVPLDHPGPETYRRAVYHQGARASVVDVLTDFDQPDNSSAAPRRASTTTPLQALTLLNHAFMLDLAQALAARLETEAGRSEPAAAIVRAYALAYGRPPTAPELAAGAQLIQHFGLPAFCRALLNSDELIFLN